MRRNRSNIFDDRVRQERGEVEDLESFAPCAVSASANAAATRNASFVRVMSHDLPNNDLHIIAKKPRGERRGQSVRNIPLAVTRAVKCK